MRVGNSKAGGIRRGHFIFDEFDRDLVIGLRHVLFEEDLAVEDLKATLDIFEAEAYVALVQLIKIGLGDTSSVMMKADEEFWPAGILGQVDKTGVAVFEDIVHQLLDYPEYNKFIFRLEPFSVVMEPGAGVHAAGAADFLKQVVYRGFQPEVFEGRGHEGVTDIAYQLDRVVNDLFGVINALKLGGFVEVDEVFIQVQAGGGKEGAGVVVEVGSDALAFLFLEPDAGVEKKFLLVLLHALELMLVADNLALVEYNEDDQPDGKGKHPNRAEEQHERDATIRVSDF